MNEQNNMINEEYTLLSELNRDAKISLEALFSL